MSANTDTSCKLVLYKHTLWTGCHGNVFCFLHCRSLSTPFLQYEEELPGVLFLNQLSDMIQIRDGAEYIVCASVCVCVCVCALANLNYIPRGGGTGKEEEEEASKLCSELIYLCTHININFLRKNNFAVN